MAELGWVGFGEMGGRIAARLLREGHEVSGWNRTRAKAEALERDGLTIAATPRELAERVPIVVTMLTDAAAVRDVLTAPDGILAGLQPGAVVVEMSTIAPDASRELAQLVAGAGGSLLDCPVSGGIAAAPAGDLSLMVGGDAAALAAVRPVLDSIAKRVTHIGANGQALVMKIAINLSLAVQMVAFSEGVLLAERHGIARETAVDALTHSAVASPNVKHRGPAVLPGALPDPAWFNCRMMQKDLLFALELGRAQGVALPATSLAGELMSACRGLGLGDEDFSAVYHALARLSGVPEEAIR